MNELPDDLHRLIHDVLSELGWSTDPKVIAKQVERLDLGLPVEDEFSVVCSWLGKCQLLHKLDQHQMPIGSLEQFQVPDILAKFSTQRRETPVLIEVKSNIKNTLSFKPKYLSRLQNYADLLGMPLLIAWKFHSLWILFEAKHLKKANVNFNISYGDALKENLMGVLAGDISYVIAPGVGLHLRMQKDELISTQTLDSKTEEEWKMHISEVSFTNRDGKSVSDLSPEVQQLLLHSDLNQSEAHADDHIVTSFTVGNDGMQFAHQLLVRLLNWSQPDNVQIPWRRESRKEKLNTIDDIRLVANLALKEKVVNYVFHQQPGTCPDFVEGITVE